MQKRQDRGRNGGKVVFSGSVEELKNADTSTGVVLQQKKIDIKKMVSSAL